MLPIQTLRHRDREAGFTLIELSIVLIIIGLLIGGVLQGQEMINNTRIKTTVSQTDSIQASVQTFQDKFGELPGDFGSAGLIGATDLAASDDDGMIEAATADTAVALDGAIAASTEGAIVFNHLAAANLLQGVDNLGAGQTTSTMGTKIDGGSFDVATFNYAVIPDGVGIRLRAGTAAVPTALLPPQDAFSLDTKYDDGVPDTGRWQSVGTGVTCVAAANTWATGAGTSCMTVISIR